MDNFAIDIHADGVAQILFDAPGRSVNVVSHAMIAELAAITARLRDDDGIRGAVLFSTKPSGLGAGADLKEMLGDIDRWSAARTQDALRAGVGEAAAFSIALRALESCGKPVACIAHGVALGGAFELFLAAHRRIAIRSEKLRMALPEASIGLMPGAGATQRLPRIIGMTAALPLLLDGAAIDLTEALANGLIHESCATVEEGVAAARRWIAEGGHEGAPWDAKGFALPGGGPHSAAGYARFGPAIAARLAPANAQPGTANILKALYEGVQVPMDAALRIEIRYFFNTTRLPGAKAAIERFFSPRAPAGQG